MVRVILINNINNNNDNNALNLMGFFSIGC